MGWTELDNKLKKYIDRQFVSCVEAFELSYIKKAVKEVHPQLEDSVIDAAILHCCRSIPAPRPKEKFLTCLKKKLEEEKTL